MRALACDVVPEHMTESIRSQPHPRLRPWVTGYSGSRLQGFAEGVHLALPSPFVVVVIGLGDPIEVAADSDSKSDSRSLRSLAAALRTGPRGLAHSGRAFDISIEMTPAGALRLLGLPGPLLSDRVVDLADLWGKDAEELIDRASAADDWPARFAAVDSILNRRARDVTRSDDALARAWDLLVSTETRLSIGDLAEEVGYSRRHLHHRFVAEYGTTPKQTARLVRFQRSADLLRRRERRRRRGDADGMPTLSEVAVMSGFYDQAHLARDWNDLIGCPPSEWLATEDLPFVQDSNARSQAPWEV